MSASHYPRKAWLSTLRIPERGNSDVHGTSHWQLRMAFSVRIRPNTHHAGKMVPCGREQAIVVGESNQKKSGD